MLKGTEFISTSDECCDNPADKNKRKHGITKAELRKKEEGVISILLAVLMVPFLSLAALMIEVGRFQSAMRSIDESIGISAFSVLSGYDSYLLDRFGLLALAQQKEKTPESIFQTYFYKQLTVDDRAMKAETFQVNGISPLADTDVLKQQIESYYSVTGPLNAFADVLDIDYLKKETEKIYSWLPALKIAASTADTADTCAKYADSLEEAQKSAKEAREAYDDYNTAYDEWKESVKDLIDELDNEPDMDDYVSDDDDADEQADAKEEYEEAYDEWEEDVETARSDVKTKAVSYKSAITSLKGKMDSLESNITGAVEANQTMTSSIHNLATDTVKNIDSMRMSSKDKDFDDRIKKAANEDEKKAIEAEKKAYDNKLKNISTVAVSMGTAVDNQATAIKDNLQIYTEENFQTAMEEIISQEDGMKEWIDAKKQNSITSSSSASSVCSAYHGSIDNILDLTDEKKIKDYVKEMEDEVKDNTDYGILEYLVDIISALVDFDFAVKPELNVDIDMKYYGSEFGGLPSQKDRTGKYSLKNPYEESDMMRSIAYLKEIDPDLNENDPYGENYSLLATVFDELINKLNNANEKCKAISTATGIAWFKAIAAALKAVGELFVKFIETVVVFVTNIVNIIVDWLYDGLVLNTYFINKLSCRTNYGEFTDISRPSVTPGSRLPLIGAFTSTQTSYSFMGAELEYVIGGTSSEYLNQTITCLYLTALRMIPDSVSIVACESWNTILTGMAATFWGAIVAVLLGLLLVIGEAIISVFLLVNGVEVPFVKIGNVHPYLSAEGIGDLVKAIFNIVSSKIDLCTDAVKGKFNSLTASSQKLNAALENKNKIEFSKYGKELLSLDYKQHCFIILLCFNEKEKLNRLADIIQMEMTMRNHTDNAVLSEKVSNVYKPFDIDKAYTAIRAEVKGKFSNLFPVPVLSESSAFSFDRIIYRGY